MALGPHAFLLLAAALALLLAAAVPVHAKVDAQSGFRVRGRFLKAFDPTRFPTLVRTCKKVVGATTLVDVHPELAVEAGEGAAKKAEEEDGSVEAFAAVDDGRELASEADLLAQLASHEANALLLEGAVGRSASREEYAGWVHQMEKKPIKDHDKTLDSLNRMSGGVQDRHHAHTVLDGCFKQAIAQIARMYPSDKLYRSCISRVPVVLAELAPQAATASALLETDVGTEMDDAVDAGSTRLSELQVREIANRDAMRVKHCVLAAAKSATKTPAKPKTEAEKKAELASDVAKRLKKLQAARAQTTANAKAAALKTVMKAQIKKHEKIAEDLAAENAVRQAEEDARPLFAKPAHRHLSKKIAKAVNHNAAPMMRKFMHWFIRKFPEMARNQRPEVREGRLAREHGHEDLRYLHP